MFCGFGVNSVVRRVYIWRLCVDFVICLFMVDAGSLFVIDWFGVVGLLLLAVFGRLLGVWVWLCCCG